MRNKKMVLGLFITLITVMLCGCGEQLYDLTEDETNSIAAYAAHVISKHNISQEKGIIALNDSQEEEAAESIDVENTETDTPLEGSADEEGSTADEQEEVFVSLQEALDIEGLAASFDSYEVREDYIEGDYYAIDAPAGSRLLVLHFSLTNPGDADVACDVLSRSMMFQVTVNDTYEQKSDVTILLDDLSTYQGTIAAGSTKNTVLIFTMPAEELESVDQITLKITKDGASQSVQLK